MKYGRKLVKEGRKATFVLDGKTHNAQVSPNDSDNTFVVWHNMKGLPGWLGSSAFGFKIPDGFKFGYWEDVTNVTDNFPEFELI